MSLAADNLVVVLHQIRSPDNLGAIARLMANFGYQRLVLSEPRTYTLGDAQKLGVRADPVLERIQLALNLQTAIGESVYALGTTSRLDVKGRRACGPEEAIAKLAEASLGGKVALVFGGEKRGLSDDELSLCQEIATIPTHPQQPSMNLAQSAAVFLYLCSRADAGEGPYPDPGAQLRVVHALEEAMHDVLLTAGFLNPQAPEHSLRELQRSLLRGRLTQREAEMWLAAFRHLKRAVARAD